MKQFPLILLADGEPGQSGVPKGLIEYNGRPWLVHQLRRFAESHGHRVVVVLGRFADIYLSALPWLRRAGNAEVTEEGMQITVVVDDHPERGHFSSLQIGARVILREKFTGAYVLPLDVPVAELEVWTHLRNSMGGDTAACIPEWQGRPGYPVLLSHRYLETLLEMPAQSKLDVQLRCLPPERMRHLAVEDASVVSHFMGTGEPRGPIAGRGELA